MILLKNMEKLPIIESNQQKFHKSFKGIKKLLKSGKIEPRTDEDTKQQKEKKPKKEKGLVYISHIPHGFYENEMTQYFKQFGVVTNARVLRSRRTGRSKGAAFVEFLEPAVAHIVADTMNNYLMGKRLLKAVLIPPEKQRLALRKNWNPVENPSNEYRRKMKKNYNENGTATDDIKLARRLLKNLRQTKSKLKDMGVDYDFFNPVDVPPELVPMLDCVPSSIAKQENDRGKNKAQNAQQKKKGKKPTSAIKEVQRQEQKKVTFEGQEFINLKTAKKDKRQESESGDSDDFDSDAFEQTVESDDEFDSGEDGSDAEVTGDSADEISEDEPPPPPVKSGKKNQQGIKNANSHKRSQKPQAAGQQKVTKNKRARK